MLRRTLLFSSPLFPYEIKIPHSLTPKFFPMFEGQPKGLFALALAGVHDGHGATNVTKDLNDLASILWVALNMMIAGSTTT